MFKKKIAFITSGVGIGGAEKQLAMLAWGLKSRGHDVLLVSLTKPFQGSHLPDFDGLDVIFVEMKSFFYFVNGAFRIGKIFAKHKPNYIHGWMFAGNIVASLIGLMFGYKFLHSLRSSDMDHKRYRIQMLLNLLFSKFAFAVVSNSYRGAEYYTSRGFSKKNMLVIPNGINTAEFYRCEAERFEIRKSLRLNQNALVLLYAARVDPMKGHNLILSLAEFFPEIVFLFVGSGTEHLDKPCNVLTLGIRQDMRKIYNAADWLISLSNFGEGFPNVIGEAMACGLPVFANDVGDSWRIIGSHGAQSVGVDARAISIEMKKVLKTETSMVSAGGCVRRISSHFSVNKMVAAYVKVYERS